MNRATAHPGKLIFPITKAFSIFLYIGLKKFFNLPKIMYKNISGIILSGGKSSRMGTDKAQLKLGNETIISRITNLLKSIFLNVIIVTDKLSDYLFLDVPIYQDIYKQRGPLSGVHSGLIFSKTDENFIVSCDLPMISKEMISYIVEYKSNKPIKYCVAGGRHHYLAGIYNKSIVQDIEAIFLLNEQLSTEKVNFFSMKYLLSKLEAEIIFPENLPYYKPEIFFNVNKPEDYELLKKYIKSSK